MRKIAGTLFGLAFIVTCASCVVFAQSPSAVEREVTRYQFGDDPAWASPAFDDTSWPIAQQGRWPQPAFHSDGFVWVRLLVPVRSDTAEPLALHVTDLSRAWMADEIFVNGVRVGAFGSLPPTPFVPGLPLDSVFPLPAGLTHPGAVARVALRIWYPPYARMPRAPAASQPAGTAPPSGGATAVETMKKQSIGFDAMSLAFDQSRTLQAEQAALSDEARLRNILPITLNCLILLIGLAILLLARSSRNRDLYLYGAMLATFPWITLFFEFIDARFAILSEPQSVLLQVISQLPAMILTIEFIWRINGFNDVWFKRLTYAAMALFNIGVLVAFVPSHPSGFVALALVGYRVTLQSFNVLTIVPNLWVIFVKRQRRLIAFAMLLVPSASLAEGFRNTAQSADLFDLAFFLSGFFLTAILAHQAWKEWRSRDALQAEFEAARELQQRLISPAVNLPGFRIESAYKPALHVGGDFFYIRPEDDASVLVVIGDVSGKGLRAAMTVNSVIGALRTMPPLPPARILNALNRGLVGQLQGGFVTCSAARITPEGQVTIANAGHLSPYHRGAEIPVIAGLPLGIDASAEYEERDLALNTTGSLTFLSDGVVEARNARGELFGFDRIAAISSNTADQIAKAAEQFGQEDDITVLTIRFAPAEVMHA